MATIVLTGGGTGGHIMPNIALIPALRELFDKIYYAGVRGGREEAAAKKAGVPFIAIPAVKLERQKVWKNALVPARLAACVSKAKAALREIEPDVVLSKGGFVSLPCALAAKQLGIPVITHESDISLGLANKLISRFSYATVTSFPQTRAKGAVCLGNPLRRELFAPHRPPALSKIRPTLLIVGGSCGAQSLNQAVFRNLDELCARYNVVHITGKKENLVHANYYPLAYAENIFDLYAGADVVISRCGANAAGELMAMHKKVIFVPLDNRASRGDQRENAAYYAKMECAAMCDEKELSAHPVRLVEQALRRQPPAYTYDRDTDKKIAQLCLKAAREGRKKGKKPFRNRQNQQKIR